MTIRLRSCPTLAPAQAPERVVAPTSSPITLDELRAHVVEEGTDRDAELQRALDDAVAYFEGPDGALGGVALMEQQWVDRFDSFGRRMTLSLAPVIDLVSVNYVDALGVSTPLGLAAARLVRSRGGTVSVEIVGDLPATDRRADAVTITYRAGVADGEAAPGDLRRAILMLAGHYWTDASGAEDIGGFLGRVIRKVKRWRV